MTTGPDVDDVDEVTADDADRSRGEAGAEGDVAKEEVGDADGAERAGAVRRVLRWCKAKWLPVTASALLVAALALSAALYWYQYRPEQQTDSAAADAAKQAASDGAVAILSYSPNSLDHDFTAAKSHLTGDFLSYYTDFTGKIVGPAAKQKGLKTSAAVLQAGVSELQPDRAVVLLFVDQSTTSTDRPDPAMSARSVLVTMTKVKGNWLISKFEPL
jgi:Mce-associated membrane protein